MKLLTLLAILLLIYTASAERESIDACGYKFEFEMDQQHTTDEENSLIQTESGIIEFNSCQMPPSVTVGDAVGADPTQQFEIRVEADGGTPGICPKQGNYVIVSSMNITDTIDFLRTLKVTPVNT